MASHTPVRLHTFAISLIKKKLSFSSFPIPFSCLPLRHSFSLIRLVFASLDSELSIESDVQSVSAKLRRPSAHTNVLNVLRIFQMFILSPSSSFSLTFLAWLLSDEMHDATFSSVH